MSLTQTSPRSLQALQKEYDYLFEHEVIRDDDRAYLWHARQIKKYASDYESVLDVACGAGFFLNAVRRVLGSQVRLSGMDISNTALEMAAKQCPDAVLTLAQAESLPYPPKSFSAITCLGSLEHFLDIPAAVSEMSRVLKDDGILYILVPNIFWYKDLLSVMFLGKRKVRNQTHERFASEDEWRETLEKAGVRVTKTLKYNGIARRPLKQWFKDLLIPLRFSYHFVFICKKNEN